MKKRLRKKERGEVRKVRDEVAYGMICRGGAGAGRHKDRKKEGSRRACRGRYRGDM